MRAVAMSSELPSCLLRVVLSVFLSKRRLVAMGGQRHVYLFGGNRGRWFSHSVWVKGKGGHGAKQARGHFGK